MCVCIVRLLMGLIVCLCVGMFVSFVCLFVSRFDCLLLACLVVCLFVGFACLLLCVCALVLFWECL